MPANFSDAEQRANDPTGHEQRFDSEKTVNRNPHPDFKRVETSRPDWSDASQWHFTKTKQPGWRLGQGANDDGECLKKKHIEIDPYEEGRPATFNYKLLISGIIPRPIGFVSTRSEDGASALCSTALPVARDPKALELPFTNHFSRQVPSRTSPPSPTHK